MCADSSEHNTPDSLASTSLGNSKKHSVRRLSSAEAAKIVAGAQASAQAAAIKQRPLRKSAEKSHRPAESSNEGRQAARQVLKQRNDPLAASANLAEAPVQGFEMEARQSGAASAEVFPRVDLAAPLGPQQPHLLSSDSGILYSRERTSFWSETRPKLVCLELHLFSVGEICPGPKLFKQLIPLPIDCMYLQTCRINLGAQRRRRRAARVC